MPKIPIKNEMSIVIPRFIHRFFKSYPQEGLGEKDVKLLNGNRLAQPIIAIVFCQSF